MAVIDKECNPPADLSAPVFAQPLPEEYTLPSLTPPLPPEALPPGTPLPEEKASAKRRSSMAAKWKKLAYILVGTSALTLSLMLGISGPTDAETSTHAAAYQKYALIGTLHYTVYDDVLGSDWQPLPPTEGEIAVHDLRSEPMTLPQPTAPNYGAYTFRGWAALYNTSAGKVWTLLDDTLTADLAARIRPEKDGDRTVALHAVWQQTGENEYPWTLVLDSVTDTTVYQDVSVPLASGGSVYLCAYPEPVRPGYRFIGWLDRDGKRVDVLPPTAFFDVKENGETDWSSPVPVTLTASWTKA